MKYLYLSFALIAAGFATSARAEITECTEITAIPVVITVQGIYCLTGNLSSAQTSGRLIDIQTNNVTIDMNGFKLGGLAAGAGTTASGIFAESRKNITIRNGAIRGFFRGILLDQSGIGVSSGHLVEDMLFDGNRFIGILASGSGMIIRRNRVVNTGPGSVADTAAGIFLNFASNSVVADNLVSGTSETFSVEGILVQSSTLIEVRGNIILDMRDVGIKRGINVVNGTEITAIDNLVFNTATTGTDGIFATASTTGFKCTDNIVAGFTSALTGCDFIADNILP